jgi:hypothetical protein
VVEHLLSKCKALSSNSSSRIDLSEELEIILRLELDYLALVLLLSVPNECPSSGLKMLKHPWNLDHTTKFYSVLTLSVKIT